MKKGLIFCGILILATGIMIKVQAKEDAMQPILDRFIVQLKKICHYEENIKTLDNKNIQILIIDGNIISNANCSYENYESNNKHEITFNNVKSKNADNSIFINIKLYNSSKEAIEALFANIAAFQMLCSHQTKVKLLKKDDGFEYGDYAVCVDDRTLAFSRANACFYIRCSKGPIDSSYHGLFQLLDEACSKQIKSDSIDNNKLAVVVSSQHDAFHAKTNIESTKANTTSKRKQGEDEMLEQELKAMPKGEVHRHCLEKALELSESPDDKPEELMLYLRGLPVPEADDTVKVLHRIGSNSRDANLLSAAAQMQGKWLSTFSETRRIFIEDLASALKTDDGALRRRAIESLGRSGSLDALPILLRELESRPGDKDAIAAIGRLLVRRPSDGAMDEGRSKELEKASADFLQSLETLRKLYEAQ